MATHGQVKWLKSDADNSDDETNSSATLDAEEPKLLIESTIPIFIEVQELVSRVYGGLQFGEEIFNNPVLAHTRVLWLQTARWIKFEQNYDEVEQRFSEAHVSPMKFARVVQLCEEFKKHCFILETEADTLGAVLDELAHQARLNGCVTSKDQYDVLRAILLSERWHPEVKGHISDVAEFEQYWNAREAVNMGFIPDEEGPGKSDMALFSINHQAQHPYHRFNQTLTDCLDPGAEACTVLCGTVDFLRKPLIALVHCKNPISNSCISEVDVPVRFIFAYLGAPSKEFKYSKLGRIFGVMMSNPLFRGSVYEARSVTDLIKSIDYFMTDALVMPIARYANAEALAAMARQIEAYKKEKTLGDDAKRLSRSTSISKRPSQADMALIEAGSRKMSALDLATQAQLEGMHRAAISSGAPMSAKRRFLHDFCPPFIDLARGIKPWIKRYKSDFKDGVTKENVAIVFGSVLFLYFVNLAPSITFAAILNSQVDEGFTVTLTLLSTGVYLIIFTLLAGQPLALIGITGPTFILENSIASIALTAGVPLLKLRFWVAVYCSVCGLFFLTFNATVLANHVRRSVEEVFNAFIAFFFLLKALFTMFRLIPGEPSASATETVQLTYKSRLAIAGATLFLAFIKLQFCLFLAKIKQGNYFRRNIRKVLGAVNVPLGMVLIAVINQIFFLGFKLPMVNVPPSNEINVSLWINPPELSTLNEYPADSFGLVHGIGFAIGLTMCIIVFTETAFNGITAMKNKAVKANVFPIDLLLLTIVFPLTSGFLGWPFVSGATVRTMSNLAALVKLDNTPAPGMRHKVIGTVEQRVSGIMVGLLVGLSVFLGSVLRFIPVAALYGMFLYMGVMGLRNLQFFDRCLALMKRRKHWEDWECVRGLPSKHILVFAVIQSFMIAILVALNVISEFTVVSYAGVIFPIILFAYALIRELAFPRWRWLSVYLHQLDRKYKLNPSVTKPVAPLPRCISITQKDSITSFANNHYAMSQDETTTTRILDYADADNDQEYSDHEDGVVRRTWAT